MSAGSRISDDTRYFEAGAFELESGATLPEVQVAYRTWGWPALGGGNAVLVCHALTGSADVDRWWSGLLGPGRALDPRHDFIIASNVLGGCYGTTGPTSPQPGTGERYGPDFPIVTVRDMVRLQHRLLRALGIERLALVVGGSLGGMQALEWAALFPGEVAAIAPLSTSGRHSAWAIGVSAAQRAAIAADGHFRGGFYPPEGPPAAGLAAARQMAMLSYRGFADLGHRFGRRAAADGSFAVESYLAHQGRSLVERFDANSYVTLSRAMDTHDLGRGRGSYEAALAGLDLPALVLSSTTDGLYPPEEQEELAALLPQGELLRLPSVHGHDAFLIETEAVSRALVELRARVAPAPRVVLERAAPALSDTALVAGGAR